MHYYHQLNHVQRRKFVRRVGLLFIILALVVATIAVVIYKDNRRSLGTNTIESSTSEMTTSTFEPSVQIFRTAYFQFQANNSWSQAVPESTDSKFVYRGKRGSLIEQELIIYVNQIPDSLVATRVLPISADEGRELDPAGVSKHCGDQVPVDKVRPKPIIQEGVSFSCSADSSLYTVLVGIKGGGINLPLKRPDGTLATYAVYYSNVMASPEGSQLEQIIRTFQAR